MRFLHSSIAVPTIVQAQQIDHVVNIQAKGIRSLRQNERKYEMAILDFNHGAGHQQTGRTAGLFNMLGDYLARRSIYRQTVNELNALSDRDLKDLGIHRLDIKRIAAEASQPRA